MNGRARFPFTRIMSGSLSGHRPPAAGTALLLALAAAFLIPFVSSSQGAQKAAYAGRYQSSDSCKLPAPPSRDILLDLATKCCAKPPGTSGSCKYISTADQYVVVKDADPNKPWGFLIIPTFAVTGIEDTKHTDAAPVVDFWQHGWNGDEKLSEEAGEEHRPCHQLEARAGPGPAPHPPLLRPAVRRLGSFRRR